MSIPPVINKRACRSQAHLRGFAVDLERVSETARGCLSFCLCVHLKRVCFASCEEKATRIDGLRSFRNRSSSGVFAILSRRGNIANLLAQNPNNKGSARMGRSHVTPEPPPPPIPGGSAGPLKICTPTVGSLLGCSSFPCGGHMAQSVECGGNEFEFIRIIIMHSFIFQLMFTGQCYFTITDM